MVCRKFNIAESIGDILVKNWLQYQVLTTKSRKPEIEDKDNGVKLAVLQRSLIYMVYIAPIVVRRVQRVQRSARLLATRGLQHRKKGRWSHMDKDIDVRVGVKYSARGLVTKGQEEEI